jgi:hypothetical protein
MSLIVAEASHHRRQSLGDYDLGISASTIWSTLKLADFCRGGNSLKLSSH